MGMAPSPLLVGAFEDEISYLCLVAKAKSVYAYRTAVCLASVSVSFAFPP